MSILSGCFNQTTAAGIVAAAAVLASCAQGAKTQSDPTALAAKVAELEAKVAYLSNRQNIHDVYLQYMRGFDRNDVELMRTAFWPDVQINYGTQSNSFDEFVARHLNEHTKDLAHWGHLITNESVDIEGDVAYVETYVTRLSNGKKDRKSMIVMGRYVDRLDRRHGEWRIAMREFIPTFLTQTDTTVDSVFKEGGWSHSACGMGTLDKHDPSYRRPLTARVDKEMGPACAE
jgi:SnoaL-like domain